MQRARTPALVAVLASGVVLLTACSDPEPASPPSAPASAPSPAAPATVAPTTAAPSSATPTPTPTVSSAAPSARPSSGGDPSVEPSRPVETAPPKKLDEPTKTAGAEVSLVSVRATTIKASSPGDSSGPGILVRLRLRNTTGKTLDTSFVQVNVSSDAGDPGTFISGSPTKLLPGSVRKGASAQGTYAFLLADATASPVTVSVYVTSGQPVVTFRGRAS